MEKSPQYSIQGKWKDVGEKESGERPGPGQYPIESTLGKKAVTMASKARPPERNDTYQGGLFMPPSTLGTKGISMSGRYKTKDVGADSPGPGAYSVPSSFGTKR